MTTELEEHLVAAMRTSVADARLNTDVVAAAARAHRRRRAVRRGATALGGLTLAAAVTGVVAVNGTAPTSPPAQVQQPAIHNARYVATEVSDAIARTEEMIEHSTVRITHESETSEGEEWRDGVTGDTRRIDVQPNGTKLDYLIKHDGDHVTTMLLDYSTREWYSDSFDSDAVDKGAGMVPRTADEIKTALEKQTTLAILGKETLDGRATLHLKLSGELAVPKERGSYELWVDAETYELVRVVAQKRPSAQAKPVVARWDYTYLARTEENLARFTLTPPAGFTKAKPQSRKKPQG